MRAARGMLGQRRFMLVRVLVLVIVRMRMRVSMAVIVSMVVSVGVSVRAWRQQVAGNRRPSFRQICRCRNRHRNIPVSGTNATRADRDRAAGG